MAIHSTQIRNLRLVLRELNGLSYQEIAHVMGIPIGTVMSSLSRARQKFRGEVDNQLERDGTRQTGVPRQLETDETEEADEVLV